MRRKLTQRGQSGVSRLACPPPVIFEFCGPIGGGDRQEHLGLGEETAHLVPDPITRAPRGSPPRMWRRCSSYPAQRLIPLKSNT